MMYNSECTEEFDDPRLPGVVTVQVRAQVEPAVYYSSREIAPDPPQVDIVEWRVIEIDGEAVSMVVLPDEDLNVIDELVHDSESIFEALLENAE